MRELSTSGAAVGYGRQYCIRSFDELYCADGVTHVLGVKGYKVLGNLCRDLPLPLSESKLAIRSVNKTAGAAFSVLTPSVESDDRKRDIQ